MSSTPASATLPPLRKNPKSALLLDRHVRVSILTGGVELPCLLSAVFSFVVCYDRPRISAVEYESSSMRVPLFYFETVSESNCVSMIPATA